MDEKFYLLGLFAGDGWFQTRGIAIGTNSEKFAEKISQMIDRNFSKSKIKKRIYKDGHIIFTVYLWKASVQKEFEQLLQTSKNKSKTFQIPIMDNSQKRDFIAGLFDAEASSYFWKNKPRVGLGIYNKVAAEFIKQTLRNDGIKCYLSKCKNGEFKIDFTGDESVRIFFDFYPVLRICLPRMGKSTL